LAAMDGLSRNMTLSFRYGIVCRQSVPGLHSPLYYLWTVHKPNATWAVIHAQCARVGGMKKSASHCSSAFPQYFLLHTCTQLYICASRRQMSMSDDIWKGLKVEEICSEYVSLEVSILFSFNPNVSRIMFIVVKVN
jgi:hypothetical protein